MVSPQPLPAHFKGKEAIEHVVEAQAQGIVSSVEMHGAEIPGHLSAGCDAAKETAIFMTFLWLICQHLHFSYSFTFYLLAISLGGWILWKAGRSAWLGWARLERLHRIVAQEKWEIEHNRSQEREELKILYAAKGFEGPLLEDVMDVLMADGDRLLRIMVQEELGLSLANYEHPLKQGLGAAIGSLASASLCLGFYFFWPVLFWLGSFIVISCATSLAAFREHNKIIHAVVWNLALACLAFSFVYLMLIYLLPLP